MKMKNITIIAILGLSLIGFAGCNSWLDIKPESELILDDYWQSESQADAVIIAAYRKLTEVSNMSRMMVWGELRSDNLSSRSATLPDEKLTAGLSKILAVDINPNNIYCQWGTMYTVINYCNTFLHYAPGVMKIDKNFTQTKLNCLEAEARSIRALCYFYLVRTFKEVPLITQPSIDDTQNYKIPKSSERILLDSIIADLKFAQKYARTNYGQNQYNKGRITLNAVNALLADVYLWDQQYVQCVDACNRVLSDKELKLVDGENMYYNVFGKGNSTESIFELQFDDLGVKNEACQAWYGSGTRPFGDLCFSTFLVSGTQSPFNYTVAAGVIESVEDMRATDFFSQASGAGVSSIYKYATIQTEKFILNGNLTSLPYYRGNTPNWIVYRLSDVMLMKAEALTVLNRDDEDRNTIMSLVNKTYLRSNTTTSSDSLRLENYNTSNLLQNLVLRERQRELLFEGKRWFDLMRLARRTNSPNAILNFVSPKFTGDGDQGSKMSIMDALYMPIAQSELNLNTALVQNPYYNNFSTSK